MGRGGCSGRAAGAPGGGECALTTASQPKVPRGATRRLGVAGAGAGGCAKKVELKMTVDVLAEPGTADVEYRNKSLGPVPQRIGTNHFWGLSPQLFCLALADAQSRSMQ